MSEHDAQIELFLSGRPVAIDTTLRTLPRTANLDRAVAVVLRLLEQPHWIAAADPLPAHLVRAVLSTPATTPSHVFLKLAVPQGHASTLKKAWHAAVNALRELADTQHPLDTPERRTRLAAIATSRLLPAIQGVVANTPEVPIEMLAVLALDGSDASLDALIPHLDLALGARDARLERLAKLRPFVKSTPALEALFAELDGALGVRRSTSPALAFGEQLGLGRLSELWFSFQLFSSARNQAGVPQFQGFVRVDSREERWFTVLLERVAPSADRSKDRATRFDLGGGLGTSNDELAIGRCLPRELASWLRNSSDKLEIQWERFFIRTNADATKISSWLIAG